MKKMTKTNAILMASLMAFVACNKETDFQGKTDDNQSAEKLTLTINACSPETKTVFGDKGATSYPVTWSSTGEVVKIAEVFTPTAGDVEKSAYSSTGYTLENENATAKFTFELSAKGDEGTYDYRAVYPASAYTDVVPAYNDLSLVLPSTQTPAASSPDPAATLLYAGVAGLTSQPTTTLNLAFAHISAYGKMTILNADDAIGSGETIESVTVSVPAGGFYYYWSDGHTLGINSTKTDQVVVNTDNVDTSTGDFVLWFSCLPKSLAIGDIFTVKITTDADTYVRNIPLTKALSFTSGQVSKFSVDMASAAPLIYSTEFNYSIDGSSYSSSTPIEGTDADGTSWYVTYGNWNNSNTAQLRVYSAGNYGSVYNGFDCSNVTNVYYDAKVSNTDLKLNTYYSTDSGASWTKVDDAKALTTDFKRYYFQVSATGEYAKVRIKFEVAGSKPSSSYYALTIDKVEIYGNGSIILEPAITADNISDIPAVGGAFTNGTYAIHNFPGDVDDVTATCDNTIVTDVDVDNAGHFTYTVAPNYGSSNRNGSITISSTNGASKTITVGQIKSTLSVSTLIVTIPNDATTGTFTVTTQEFGWIAAATAEDGMNLAISGSASGDATASATITVSSTTDATASLQTLGTVKVYRTGTTAATDPQVKEIVVRKASTAAAKYFRKVNTITSGKQYLIVKGGGAKALVPSTSGNKKSSVDVTIDGDDKIESSSYTSYAVTITKNGDNYDISFVDSETTYYLVYNSGTNLTTQTSATKNWTVQTTAAGSDPSLQGSFRFVDSSTTSRGLIINSSNQWGGYAVSNVNGSSYWDLDLYKLDD